jgi:RNA polymerase sigma factor (sigma-70 family)
MHPEQRLDKYGRLTAAQWRLMAAYHDAAYRVAARRMRDMPALAHLIEEAVLDGLCHAALTWSGAGGHSFYGWMRLSVLSRVSGALRQEQTRERGRHAHLRGCRGDRRHNGEPLGFVAALHDPGPLPEEDDLPAAVARQLDALPPRQRRVLRCRFAEGLTYAQLGRELGCARDTAARAVAEALAVLAVELARRRRAN